MPGGRSIVTPKKAIRCGPGSDVQVLELVVTNMSGQNRGSKNSSPKSLHDDHHLGYVLHGEWKNELGVHVSCGSKQSKIPDDVHGGGGHCCRRGTCGRQVRGFDDELLWQVPDECQQWPLQEVEGRSYWRPKVVQGDLRQLKVWSHGWGWAPW